MKVFEANIKDIKPYTNNPRVIPQEAVDRVANSIKEFGMQQPIVVDKDMVIIVGHTRLKACEALGMGTVPCVIADTLTEEQVRAYRLADNKTNEFTSWDDELLNFELSELFRDNFDMEQFGFDMGLDDEDDEDKTIIEDEVDFDAPSITQPGDVWKLGNHTLMCGDSTRAADVETLMGGAMADMLVTDPPYNVDYTGKTKEELKIQNDAMQSENFVAFLSAAFENARNAMKEGGAFYVWHASRTQTEFETALKKNDLEVRQQLIWVKQAMVLGRQDYQWRHEPCFYGWKDGAAHYFIDSRKLTTVFEDAAPDLDKMRKEELKKMLEDILSDRTSTTVIHEDRPMASTLHPTMKPVKLIARQIMNSSRQGEKVLDLFGGSGTTLIACEQLNRSAYLMEYDPHYCDVIVQRWEALTGETAVKVSA